MTKKIIFILICLTLALSTTAFSVVADDETNQRVLFDDMIKDASLFDPELSSPVNYTNSTQEFMKASYRIYKPGDDITYITYKSSERDMSGFTMLAGIMKEKNNGKYTTDFRFEVSPDGEAFTEIDPNTVSVTIPLKNSSWNYGTWRVAKFRCDNKLPRGTKYLRITFPETGEDGITNTMVQIDDITIDLKYSEKEVAQDFFELLEDAKNELSRVGVSPEHSVNQIIAFDKAIDAAEAFASEVNDETTYREYDDAYCALNDALNQFKATEIVKYTNNRVDLEITNVAYSSGLSSKKPNGFPCYTYSKSSTGDLTGSYAIYELPKKTKIQNLMVVTAHLSTLVTKYGDIVVKTAPAAASVEEAEFTQQTVSRTQFSQFSANGTKWYNFYFTVPEIPENTKYLWVELGENNDKAHGIQLLEVNWEEIATKDISIDDDYQITRSFDEQDTAKIMYDITYTGENADTEVYFITAYYSDGVMSGLEMIPGICTKDKVLSVETEPIKLGENDAVKTMIFEADTQKPLVAFTEAL